VKGGIGLRTLKAMQRMITILALVFICVGCSAGAYIATKSSGNSRINNFYADQPPVLVMGSKFIYQDTNLSNGKSYKVTMGVKEKKKFEKKPAYWIEVSREGENYFDIYDMNLNWIGSFAGGKELEAAEPCIRVFKWPLRVGKKWDSNYTSRNYSEGFRPSPSKITVNIQTYEEVSVPAGTFKAFRIQADKEIVWYAPSIGWVVKEKIGPCGKEGWFLELMEYRIEAKIAPLEELYVPCTTYGNRLNMITQMEIKTELAE
jgi:hypothetical protein